MRDVSGIKQEKAVLRAQLLAARSRLSAEQRTGAGSSIRDALLSRPEVQMAGTIAVYYSVGAEPDTRRLVYALWKRGSYVLLPVLRADGDLDWASYEGPDSLVPGPHGLREPGGNGDAPAGVDAIDDERRGGAGLPARTLHQSLDLMCPLALMRMSTSARS